MESISYKEGVKNLQSMFPDLDLEIIKSVIESCNNDFDKTLNCLLEIAKNMREQEMEIYRDIDKKIDKNSNQMNNLNSSNSNSKNSENDKNKKSNVISIFGNTQQSKIENEYSNSKTNKNEYIDPKMNTNKVVDKQKISKKEENTSKNIMKEVETKKNSVSIGSKMKNWVSNLFKGKKKENSDKNTNKDNPENGYKKLSMDDD